LWSGDLEPRKALSLLLKALAKLPSGVAFELRVLGEGRMERRLKRLAVQLGIGAHIAWLGRLPYREAVEQCGWADVFAFTSLRDTTGTVVLEALANGLPVVCLDHQGMHDVITEHCGIKVPVTNRHQVVDGLADALTCLARDSRRRAAMSKAAIDRARDYLWTQLSLEMLDVYQRVLGRRETKNVEEERSDPSARRNPPMVSSGARWHATANTTSNSSMQPLAMIFRAVRRLVSGGTPAEADQGVFRARKVQSPR
jgi:glycosyltransferase involved in cell wall biosynthesis